MITKPHRAARQSTGAGIGNGARSDRSALGATEPLECEASRGDGPGARTFPAFVRAPDTGQRTWRETPVGAVASHPVAPIEISNSFESILWERLYVAPGHQPRKGLPDKAPSRLMT